MKTAIKIKLAMVLGGGYPSRERRLTKGVREAVIERDGGRCCTCGKPANQIDHIQDSSDDLDNLQLLCARCHNAKTMKNFVTMTPESHPEQWAKHEALMARVRARDPQRLCDRPDWVKIRPAELKRRRDTLREG